MHASIDSHNFPPLPLSSSLPLLRLSGTVLYMTSPDTPSIIVNKLNINSIAAAAGGGGMLLGYYTQLHDNVRRREERGNILNH